MIRRAFLIGALLSAGAASAQDNPVLVLNITGQAKGEVRIELRPDLAPQHVERITRLAGEGAYDNVAFHRVIPGFMAQTGDVEFGKRDRLGEGRAGTGGSGYGDLPAEFSRESFVTGVVGMARAQNPNSANSQFFIMFEPAPHLNGQYTVVGEVVSGMDVVNTIQPGAGRSGAVRDPDFIETATVE
ncbi:MAG: peptidylprolyl isomerase [Pseudomonadota bacterium]